MSQKLENPPPTGASPPAPPAPPEGVRMDNNFATASLTLNQFGICKGVSIDGHKLPHVAAARVVMEPGEITRVVLELYVSTVETIKEPGA